MVSVDDVDMVVVDSVAVRSISWEDDPDARGSCSSIDDFDADAILSLDSIKGVGGFGFSFFLSFLLNSFVLDSIDDNC